MTSRVSPDSSKLLRDSKLGLPRPKLWCHSSIQLFESLCFRAMYIHVLEDLFNVYFRRKACIGNTF
jgi:hypothetical protein